MTVLGEAFLIVLLFAPAEAEACHPHDGDVHMTFSNTATIARTVPRLYMGNSLNAGGYALALFTPCQCTRLAFQPETRMRYASWGFDAAGEAAQNRDLFALMKSALRLLAGHIGGVRSGQAMPAMLMIVGIRG